MKKPNLKNNAHNEKPIVLAPLTEDEVVKAMLVTPPMPKPKRKTKKRKDRRK